MRRLILALPVVLLAACAVGPTLDQQLSTFVGQSEGDVVARMGVPVRTYEIEGRRFLQFEQYSTVMVPGDPLYYGGWYRRHWATPSTYAQVRCDITFTLRAGRVESYAARGDGCR
ncbi:hypothetical protein [Teichococcus vastitatis]|jgi:hypothetical protein|uniref:Uncharacterized protein n=1 Tax=Teichococcus vastitatis TaxID=2307076 RepID=A0ABS9W107_9PROT|nr:hypothetical protein [Pseudoroseomonas vastitatis]MCI0752274.1 hypothetical protein [Pseudoroseomonas vastitatis]